ncbi:MAG: cobalamin-binding protein [Deltaproteobacteria bacterium]|jgi:iron complex transport system substrate-binding protein|nr:cobalamin-binding protein [Deltaproteobacteria bacterium]
MKSSCRFILIIFAFICCCRPQPGFSKALIDQLERVVAVPQDPQRVVAFAPSLTEIIYAIGQGHRLVGATVYSNFPAAAQKLPRVGTYVHLDLERIVALKPDLCIATKDGNPRTVIDRLAALNIPVYTVNPLDLKSVGQTILELGTILNASEIAAAVVEDINRRVRKVRDLVDGVSDRPRVFFQIGVKPIISVGTDTFIHELIVFAGGRNVAAGPNPYPHYSWEQVIGLSPDVIVITTMARQAVFEQVRKTWHKWSRLPAAKNGRIYLVDSDVFDRPSPRLVDGLEQLAVLLHPKLKMQLQ